MQQGIGRLTRYCCLTPTAPYRTVQRKIANAGGGGLITDNVEMVIFAVPANQRDPGTQVVLNDASVPPNQLPSNLLVPLNSGNV